MGRQAAQVVVQGRVQGVWFRASTREQASRLGVLGWVRNRDDGAVEIHAEGAPGAVASFVEWCRQGPPLAQVETVDIDWVPPQDLTSFEIR